MVAQVLKPWFSAWSISLIVVMSLVWPGWVSQSYGAEPSEGAWLKAKGLKKGDRVAFAAPAGPADRALVTRYAESLKAAGLIPVLDPRLFERKEGYLGGTDEERAKELNQYFADPTIQAIFPVRGGYGLTRILDKLDYQVLAKHPKIVTGYSDLTALHLAIARHCRLVTFHAPMPMKLLTGDEPEPHLFAGKSFRRALLSASYPNGEQGYPIDTSGQPDPVTLVPGLARGRLLGGNLTLVCSTLGTPFAIQPEGAILFLEDVNEAPYRIDRSLSQLRLAGVLGKIGGVVLGSFSTKNPEEEKQIEKLLRAEFARAPYPVIHRFPVGHTPANATLPHGAMVELDANRGRLTLLENPVVP